MAFSGIFFFFWRFMEIITLIPAMGMLAYFVDYYTKQNALTPNSILVLFIVSVLGLAWALGTTVAYARAKHAGLLVAFVDLCFIGAFIAGVYFLRGIRNADCTNFTAGGFYVGVGNAFVGYNGDQRWSLTTNKGCAMLKASWAFGIMNCLFFAITCFFALFVARNHRETVVKHHSSRHGGRRSSREYYSGSPRRSHHSSRRYYV